MDAPRKPRTSTGVIHFVLAFVRVPECRRRRELARGDPAQRDAVALSRTGVDSARVRDDSLPAHLRLVAADSGHARAVRRDRVWLLRVRHHLGRAVRARLCSERPLIALPAVRRAGGALKAGQAFRCDRAMVHVSAWRNWVRAAAHGQTRSRSRADLSRVGMRTTAGLDGYATTHPLIADSKTHDDRGCAPAR